MEEQAALIAKESTALQTGQAGTQAQQVNETALSLEQEATAAEPDVTDTTEDALSEEGQTQDLRQHHGHGHGGYGHGHGGYGHGHHGGGRYCNPWWWYHYHICRHW